jgi:integrase
MKRAGRKRTRVKDGIYRLPDGRYQLDVLDSRNRRHRPKWQTLEEAEATLASIRAQKATGQFLAEATTKTLGEAFDKMLEAKREAGIDPSRHEANIDARLRDRFGARRLSSFVDERMESVKQFMRELREEGRSFQTMAHYRSTLKVSFDTAITEGMLGPPNPMDAFKVAVLAPLKDRDERDVLKLGELADLQRASLERKPLERELSYGVRFMMQLLGLCAALRDQEAAGLCWDYVDTDGRMLYVRRVWRRGKGIVRDTKTGRSGFGDIPMNPILHAALVSWRDRLQALGYPAEGEVPVLRTERSSGLTSYGVEEHWERVCGKVGWLSDEGKLRHTYYALRHTGANLWRTAGGMGLDQLQRLMRHRRAQTTMDRYLHDVPEFASLKSEVQALGFPDTVAGIIDAIGVVLARRWRTDGIDIPCSLPRHLVQPEPEPKMLTSGNVIELLPSAISTAPTGPAIRSMQELRAFQRSEVHRLEALGRTNRQIAEELGIDRNQVADMKRTPADAQWMRKRPHATRAELKKQIREMRAADPNIATADIAAALNVHPSFITRDGRERGAPMTHPRRSYRYARHEQALRDGIAAGKTMSRIARELGLRRDTGLRNFAEKIGLWHGQSVAAEGKSADFAADLARNAAKLDTPAAAE